MSGFATDGESGGKIAFANALRGIAALMVFYYHIFDLYWFARADQARQTGLPIPDAASYPTPDWLVMLMPILSTLWGAVGVAIFFLISGFVIPFSLERHGPKGFALGRLWRIYPTYMAGFLLGVGAMLLAGATMPAPMRQPKAVLNLVPGLHNLFDAPLLDGVIWTLNVEVVFYVVILALFMLTRGNLVQAVWAMLALGLIAALLPLTPFWGMLSQIGLVSDLFFYLRYMLFILAGTVVHLHYKGRLQQFCAVLLGGGLFGLFLLLWHLTPQAWSFDPFWPGYILGMALFFGAYRLRALSVFHAHLLVKLARISYPLYVVHMMVGYSVITLCAQYGVPPTLALCLAIAAAFALASLLCRYVEMPTHRIGQSLARHATIRKITP